MSATAGREPVVTVTLVLHNSEVGLAGCIDAIRPELDDGFAKLIAVDNASPDRSAAIVRSRVPNARIISSSENLGFAAGANLAWPIESRYWFLLNPDVELEAGGLRTIAGWMDRHPQVGIASAELIAPNGSGPPRTGRALPSLVRSLLELSRMHLALPRTLRGRLLRGPYWNGGDQLDAGWVPGAAMIARREAVETAGLLDERFFLYGEDIEWCWRLREHGWAVGVCNEVTARHRPRGSVGRTFDAAEADRRMARGELAAVAVARGRRYARLYGAITTAALAIEARNPRRSPEQRTTAVRVARAWRASTRELSK